MLTDKLNSELLCLKNIDVGLNFCLGYGKLKQMMLTSEQKKKQINYISTTLS